MPTGTGKTRLAIALTDLMKRGNWASRMLFLADRTNLLAQAKKNFQALMPDVTVENITQTKKGSDKGEILFSTYPTMTNWVVQGHFSADFDLIIGDEAHRSIFQEYKFLFDFFDANWLGLTARRDGIDRNTFEVFGYARSGKNEGPTFNYEMSDAIRKNTLFPPSDWMYPLGLCDTVSNTPNYPKRKRKITRTNSKKMANYRAPSMHKP